MRNLVIIGAGGMGRTIYDMARENPAYEHEYVIKGFIDDNLSSLDSSLPSICGFRWLSR